MSHNKTNRRIVMVGTALDTMGGISSVVQGYLDAGLLDRYRIRYVVTHRDGSAAIKLAAAVNGLLRLTGIALSERSLLFHIHMSSRASFWRKFIYASVCTLLRHPYLLHIHGSEFMTFYRTESGPIGRWFVRGVFSRASAIVALSESWKEDLRAITDSTPIEVVHNAVLVPERSQTASENRSAILFLGRLGKRKGIDTLLQAFAAIASDFPGTARD